MRRDTIQLPSGRWEFQLHPQENGATVVYRHTTRPGETMRTWSMSPDPTAKELEQLALEPVSRTWVDALGARWDLSLEIPRGWKRARGGAPASDLVLVFQGASEKRIVEVPGSMQLGVVDNLELARLFDRAVQSL